MNQHSSTDSDSRKVLRFFRLATGLWVLLIGTSLFLNWQEEEKNILKTVRVEARANFNKDLTYRRWATMHGGVYVPPTDETPPNPYLSDLARRDVVTTDGMHLTLVNPAYMTRQVYELAKGGTGVFGHITSLNPIRPENGADEWETKTLNSFETGAEEISSVESMDGQPYLRFMAPLIAEKGCLKCHAQQGYKLGDIRGGISVSIPLTPYLEISRNQQMLFVSGHVLIGFLGLFGIFLWKRTVFRYQSASRQNQYYLSKAQELGKIGTWELDILDNKLVWTDEHYRIFGVPSESIVNYEVFLDRVHPEDRDFVNRELQAATRGKPFDIEHRVLIEDKITWVREKAVLKFDENGDAISAIGFTQDITERKLAESSLLESEETFRKLFEESSDAILLINDSGVFVECNQATLNLLKMTREQLRSLPPAKISPEVQPNGQRSDEAMVEMIGLACSKGGHRFDWTCVNAEGSEFIVDISLIPVTIRGQNMLHATWRDITERKRLEISLRESEERFKEMFRKHSAVMLLIDPETGLIVDANLAAEAFYGYSHEELLKSCIHHLNILPPDQIAQKMQTAKRENRNFFIFNHKNSSGDIHTVEVHSTPISVSDKELLFSIIHDISDRIIAEEERAKLEKQLQQAQKIEAIGQLAGGVAHDFNNMLGVILGHTELLLLKAGPSNPYMRDLEEIQNAAKRSAELTRQLLAFARKQTIQPKVLDLNEAVEGMLKMLRKLLGEHIDMKWHPKENLWPVKLDPSQLDQVLANLCVNARDAIADTGVLTIETDIEALDQNDCNQHPGLIAGDYVTLTVIDDGQGMDEETLGKIFEPFFTTKEVGEGTGLGLATVFGIVKQSDGYIDVSSEPGQGTIFKIYLPRYEGPIKEVQVKTVKEADKGRGETVLLVEDEKAIVDLATAMLENLGYNVLAANTPAEALSLAETHQGDIQLLLTDVVMPEMNGRELAEQLKIFYPELKCLYMSGYTADVIAHHGVLNEGIHFVQKPFSMNDLSAAIRAILGQSS